jgi:hypothetical protein
MLVSLLLLLTIGVDAVSARILQGYAVWTEGTLLKRLLYALPCLP